MSCRTILIVSLSSKSDMTTDIQGVLAARSVKCGVAEALRRGPSSIHTSHTSVAWSSHSPPLQGSEDPKLRTVELALERA